MRSIFQHQMHIMRDHNNRDSLAVQPPQEFHDIGIMPIILSGGGFIQNQNLGIHNKHRGDRYTLFLPEG